MSNRSDPSAYVWSHTHAALRNRDWIMKHMKIKCLMHDPAMYLPRRVG